MNMNPTGQQRRNTRSSLSYVYASYVSKNGGYVAVIDPTTDEIIHRISTGRSPAAMCLNPSGDKLYVADDLGNVVSVYSTDDFRRLGAIPVGNKPVAIFVEPGGKYGYIGNYAGKIGSPDLTVFDAITLSVIGSFYFQDMAYAFACNGNIPYVYTALKGIVSSRAYYSALAISISNIYESNTWLQTDIPDPFPDSTYNPFAVRPNGHTLVMFENETLYLLDPDNDQDPVVALAPTSLLDNTVSGVYLDNGLLFCTMREDRDFLKLFKNLDIDVNSNITYDEFKEIPSYKAQDQIRTSLNQKYIGVTVQAHDSPLGGLQIIDVDHLSSQFVELASTGDLAFFSDSKAYVGGFNSVQPIDLTTARPLDPIPVGTTYFRVKNVISGYSYQTS